MKNALVLDDHHGDNGTVTAGMILRELPNKRFEELEKRGLVREATDKEVEAGDQHAFEKDRSEDDRVEVRLSLSTGDVEATLQRIRDETQTRFDELNREHADEVKALIERAEAAEQQLRDSNSENQRLTGEVSSLAEQLGAAKTEIEGLTAKLATNDAPGDGAAKDAPAPANKKAAAPANKGA
jgi:phage terminase Nu1 subunit (DNA packaging protein)